MEGALLQSSPRHAKKLTPSCWLVGSRAHHRNHGRASKSVVCFWSNDAGAVFSCCCHVLDWRELPLIPSSSYAHTDTHIYIHTYTHIYFIYMLVFTHFQWLETQQNCSYMWIFFTVCSYPTIYTGVYVVSLRWIYFVFCCGNA